MPDHVHLLFGIVTDDTLRGTDPHRRGIPPVCPYPDGGAFDRGDSVRRFSEIQGGTVASIMRQYKSVVTKRVWAAHGRETGPVWQRGFYDRVVRTDREAEAIRRYVEHNPARWHVRDADASGHRV